MITIRQAWKDLWAWLSGTNKIGEEVPTNFENIEPIPVINVYDYCADAGDKTPKFYTPKDASGFTRTKTSMWEPVGRTRCAVVLDTANADIVGSGAIANVTLWIPTGTTATLTGESANITLVAPVGGIVFTMQMCEGTLNLASAGGSSYYARTLLQQTQVTDVS
jgi:hypothetical protein